MKFETHWKIDRAAFGEDWVGATEVEVIVEDNCQFKIRIDDGEWLSLGCIKDTSHGYGSQRSLRSEPPREWDAEQKKVVLPQNAGYLGATVKGPD